MLALSSASDSPLRRRVKKVKSAPGLTNIDDESETVNMRPLLDTHDQFVSRHEPQTLTGRTIPRDPYAAWLERREAERERMEGSSVRWTLSAVS